MKESLKQYVDGFVLPIATDQLDRYREMAEKACEVWREHGAIDYRECVLADADAKDMVSFPQLAGSQEGETVVFAWITYPSREVRDEVNAKVMADPRMQCFMDAKEHPFDCKRMAYGGFRTLVHG